MLMPGVQVGDGAIVATQSVVTKPVEPYTIVGGNPARIIRKRFDDATIHPLLDIQWWHWNIAKITRNPSAICGSDIRALQQAQ